MRSKTLPDSPAVVSAVFRCQDPDPYEGKEIAYKLDGTARYSVLYKDINKPTYLNYDQDHTMPGAAMNNTATEPIATSTNSSSRLATDNNLGSKHSLFSIKHSYSLQALTSLSAEVFPTSTMSSSSKETRSGSGTTTGSTSLSPDSAERMGRSSYDSHRASVSDRSRSQDWRHKVDAEERHKGIKEKLSHKLVPGFLK